MTKLTPEAVEAVALAMNEKTLHGRSLPSVFATRDEKGHVLVVARGENIEVADKFGEFSLPETVVRAIMVRWFNRLLDRVEIEMVVAK